VNWKIVFIGGVVFYIATFIVGMGTGPLIHDGVLKEAYIATASFWRPELNQDPPDMAALMPMWIATGLIGAFIGAGIYSIVRSSLSGAGWMRGLKFGVMLSLLALGFMGSYRGVFNLPDTIWVWWAVGTVVTYLVGGIALGFVAEKLAPVGGGAPVAARA
jgi:hypothetical protein